MDVTRYIRESCEHQNATTPEDFIGMTRAWSFVYNHVHRHMTPPELLGSLWIMSKLVNNIDSFEAPVRDFPATFASGNQTIHNTREDILVALERLFNVWPDVDADQFYQMFEDIHPFKDGNGRVGSLLWNLKMGHPGDPLHPPKFSGKVDHGYDSSQK